VGPGFFVERGIRTLRMPTLFDREPLNEPWFVDLERKILDFRPDVIIVHGIVSITSVRIGRLRHRLPNTRIVFDDHMTYNATRGTWTNLFYKVFRRLFTRILLSSGDSFVAVTYETKRFMQEVYGIPGKRIKVIPLGIDRSSFYYDSASRSDVRKKYGIKEDDTVFVYVGKIIPKKGMHILIDAALQLCKSHDDVKFLFVGGKDNAYFSNLNKKIEKVKERFIFIDAVPNSELYKYYSAADAGVWPLQCSVSMLEATACGLPTIISDKSGTTERVSWGNGLLYKESDSVDLASKMTLLLNDRLRKEMSKASLAYAETLDWENLAEDFLNTSKNKRNSI
jgi:glycosyltransferase involved in cell wall biosynthesis